MNYTDKGTINSAPMKLTLKNSGYSKITLTVKSNYDGELPLGVAGVDNPYKSDVRYTTYDKGNHMQLGETRTITVDISGTKSFVVSIGGVSVHAEISNIYFHN